MGPQKSPSNEQEQPDEKEGIITLTRRKALFGTITAGLLQSLRVPAMAQQNGGEINVIVGQNKNAYDRLMEGDVEDFDYNMNATQVDVEIYEETSVVIQENTIECEVSLQANGVTEQLAKGKVRTNNIGDTPTTVIFPDDIDIGNQGQWDIKQPQTAGLINLINAHNGLDKSILSANIDAPNDKFTNTTSMDLIVTAYTAPNKAFKETITTTIEFSVTGMVGFSDDPASGNDRGYFRAQFGTYIPEDWDGKWKPWHEALEKNAADPDNPTQAELEAAAADMPEGTIISIPGGDQQKLVNAYSPTNPIPDIFGRIKNSPNHSASELPTFDKY